MKRSLALLLPIVVTAFACGDAHLTATRDAGSDAGHAFTSDAGNERDGSTSPEALRRRTAALVTAPPRYALVGEAYRYRPKANVAVDSLTVSEGPRDLALRDAVLTWQPSEAQAGSHRVVLAGTSQGGSLHQAFNIDVATSTLRVAGDIVPVEGGRVLASDVARQQLAGVGVAVPAGAAPSALRVSVSELDLAPDIPNTAGRTRAMRFAPAGTVFDTPAQVFLPMPDDVAISPARLGAYVYDESGRWVRVPITAIDVDNRLVAARARHFSAYAIAQSDRVLTTALGPSGERSACARDPAGRAQLETPLSLALSSVNNLPVQLRALFASEDATVEELLLASGWRGSLRMVQVFDLREAGGDLALEQVVVITTVHAPGDASLAISQTDALGNLVGQQKHFASAADALTEINQQFSGAATTAHFTSATGKDRTLAVRLHLAFAPGDASREPVDVHDLGPACADADPVAYDARTVFDDDRDCDGVRDAFDAIDDTLSPRLAVSPRQVVRAFPGEPVTLRARVLGAATPERWQLLDGRGAQLTEIAGAADDRAFTAATEGRYLVSYRAGDTPSGLEHVFAIDVIAHPAVNTPPRCRPTRSAGGGFVGQPLALVAVASDDESPARALRVEWGLYDPTSGGLISAPELISANESARLLPTAPGKYVLGCRAFDGQLQGGVGTLELSIEAARNRPPELTLSPLDVTITRGRTIVLRAFAADPEGDTLSFTWRVAGSEVPAASASTDSRLELTPTQAGDLTIEATVRDARTQVRGRATVRVRDPDAPPLDVDGDGYSPDAAAARDCDDGAASVHPGASEQCNTRDDDCDGLVDEDGVCTTTCATGFVSDGAGGCTDVDECTLNDGGCDPLVACVNTPGSYVCGKCPLGYAGAGATGCTDIDECASNNGGCDPLVPCTNTPGSFRCGDCPSGYGGGTTGCADIDECATDNGGCDPLTVCVNTPGGRACGGCPPGYAGSGASGCTDVNECALDHGGCDARTTCTNTAGGRRCGACPSGFAGTGETGCSDIDECTSGSARCDPRTTCLNAEAGYGCSDCPPGFLGGGISGCMDIDECAGNHGGCDPSTACINGAGSFRCGSCPSGYLGSGETGCVDIDECASDTDGCDPLAPCTNTPGSYRCGDCPPGFRGGTAGCIDVDECANDQGGCDRLRPCVNDPGGYHCGDCPTGYDERGPAGCVDVDECAASSRPCSGGQHCTNTEGGFACACPTGFALVDDRCTDIDECENAPCRGNARCENLVGSYQCMCPPGTFDDQGDASYCAHAVVLRSGSNATCAITDRSGLFCWGGAYPSTPIRVGLSGVGHDPRAIGRADWVDVDVADHTCAIQAGSLYCWGPSQSGMLGLGNDTDTGLRPRQVGKDTDWMEVSVGAKHTCALKVSGALYCWGANDFGQLGADLKTTSVDVPRLLGGQSRWSLLSAGVFHTCARQASGTVACWGYNGFGGTGVSPVLGRTEQPEPSQIDLKAGFTELAAGSEHACGLNDGALFCWGGNGRGQLGLGSDLESALMTQIGRQTTWTRISATMWSTCGIAAGALACWGDIDGSGPVRAPTQVGKATDWTHVAAGVQHVCAVRKERVYCFGRNKFGQLGNGSDKDATEPTPVFAGRPR